MLIIQLVGVTMETDIVNVNLTTLEDIVINVKQDTMISPTVNVSIISSPEVNESVRCD